MFAFLRNKQSIPLGLDISSDEIRVLQLKRQSHRFTVKKFAALPLAPAVVVAGKIRQAEELIQALRQLLRQAGIKKCAVNVALPGNAVISQQILLPASLSLLDCEKTISTNLSRYFPGVPESLCFDFLPLASRNNSHHEILVVACRQSQVESYTAVIKSAGMQLQTLDVDKFALMRAVRFTVNTYSASDTVAMLQLGERQAELIIFCHQAIFFNQQWQVDDENSLLAALKNAWHLFFSSVEKKTVDYVVLSGKLSTYAPALTAYFTSELNLKVHTANPFLEMDMAADAASFQICAGLATRGF